MDRCALLSLTAFTMYAYNIFVGSVRNLGNFLLIHCFLFLLFETKLDCANTVLCGDAMTPRVLAHQRQ